MVVGFLEKKWEQVSRGSESNEEVHISTSQFQVGVLGMLKRLMYKREEETAREQEAASGVCNL